MMMALARFVFRHRNAVFPVVFAGLLIAQPPAPLDAPGVVAMAIAGIGIALLGQAVRVVTIGLSYIKRGGRGGRFSADGLVTGGIFSHVRNPMYVGNMLLALGFLLVSGRTASLVAGAVFFTGVYLLLGAGEARYLHERFGREFERYRDAVPAWIPRSAGLLTTFRAHRFDWGGVLVKEYGTLYTTLAIPTGLLLWKAVRSGAPTPPAPLIAGTGGALALWTLAYGVARWLKKSRRVRPRGARPSARALEVRRARIDEIDARLLRLLNDRARQVQAIFAIKRDAGVERLDPERMRRMVERLRSRNTGPLRDDEAARLLRAIFSFYAREFDAPTGEPATGKPDAGEPETAATADAESAAGKPSAHEPATAQPDGRSAAPRGIHA